MVLPFALGATDKGEYGGDIHPFSTYFYGLQRITGVLAVGLTLSLTTSGSALAHDPVQPL